MMSASRPRPRGAARQFRRVVVASRLRSVVAALLVVGLADGCSHRVSPTSAAPHVKRWVLTAEASGSEPFCVEWTLEAEAGDARALPCTTVADIRQYIRARRAAE
jgi:hypothetical protein